VTVALGRNKNTLESAVGYKKVRKYLIPNEWDLIKLGDMSTKVGSGKTPRGGEAVYQNSGIPFIRSQNVLNSRLELNGISYISESIHNDMKSTKVIPNDVLLNITGASIGRCCIVPDSFKEGNLNQHVCIIRTKDTLDRNYLVNILLSPIGQNQIMNNQAGGNREGLNFEQIRKFDIPLPPLKEQQKIASILSTWDKAIELKEKLIEQKKEQKKGLMQKLLTGEARLPGYDEEWIKIKIGKLIGEISEKSTVNNQYEVLSVTKNGIVSQNEHFKKQVASENNVGYKVIRKNNLVFSTMNLWMGSLDVLTDYEIGIVSPAYKVFEFKLENFIPSFAKFYMLSEHMIWLYNVNSEQGASIVRRNLDLKALLNTIVKVPPIQEQQAISKVLIAINNEIILLENELELLKQQKQGLMQLLLTGKVRVKV
jgi:type I restriction enzyme S subunit